MGTDTEGMESTLSLIQDDRERRRLQDLCRDGVRVFHLKGESISDKAQFLDQIAAVMNFPSYFGRNWDALEDCLTDLAWISGRELVLLFDGTDHFARKSPEEWAMAEEILRSAEGYWAREGPPRLHLIFQQAPSDPK